MNCLLHTINMHIFFNLLIGTSTIYLNAQDMQIDQEISSIVTQHTPRDIHQDEKEDEMHTDLTSLPTDLEEIGIDKNISAELILNKNDASEIEEDLPESFDNEPSDTQDFTEIENTDEDTKPTDNTSSPHTQSVSQKKHGSEKNNKKHSRSIEVTNSISDDMLGYKHWTGTYTPKIFVLRANGKKIKAGATKSIQIKNNELVVRFDYDFGYNVKKARGASEVTFFIDRDATACDITFSWNNKWRIIIDNGTPEYEESSEFEEG